MDRFPGVLKQEEVDLLEDQYTADYLFASKKDLPPLEENIGSFWHEMLSMVDIYTQQPRFNILTKWAKTLLALTNSNADLERAFSIFKKISLRT